MIYSDDRRPNDYFACKTQIRVNQERTVAVSAPIEGDDHVKLNTPKSAFSPAGIDYFVLSWFIFHGIDETSADVEPRRVISGNEDNF
jgi:hypothetical protein